MNLLPLLDRAPLKVCIMEDSVGSTEILQWRAPRWAASLKHAPSYLMRLQSSSTVYQDSKLKYEVFSSCCGYLKTPF